MITVDLRVPEGIAAMSNSASKASDTLDQLEKLIKAQSTQEASVLEILIGLGTPIASVAVLDCGNVAARVIGSPKREEASSDTAETFDSNTLFQACSISKPTTALAVFKLCQEGKLGLDIPISQYLSPEQLSWISTPKTHALISQITLRLLLSHTAGLSTHGFPGYTTAQIPTIQQILTGSPPANNEPVALNHIPGQKYSYSGGGITVIQLILETVLQKPFHQLMDETVLQPLGMTRSTYKFLPEEEKNFAPAYLTGKKMADPDHHTVPESAAAGLWTTPSDLLKAIYAVQRSLQSGDFLERTWARVMLTEIEENGMALGWAAKRDGTTFNHAGDNYPGYVCFVIGFANLTFENLKTGDAENMKDGSVSAAGRTEKRNIPESCGMAVMTSSALGWKALGKILNAVSFLKGWPSMASSPHFPNFLPFRDHERVVDERAKAWCGEWGPGNWSVLDDEVLWLKSGVFTSVRLLPAAIPPRVYDEGASIDLVADGLEMMLRLGWEDGQRVVELWQDGGVQMLKRKITDAANK